MSTDIDADRLSSLAGTVGRRLQALGFMLTTAESCTGGWVAKCITDIPGSSSWLDRGFVTYSNAAKEEMLGVRADTLAANGAVSEPVVCAMVAGALARSRAQVAVAVSGIAGPGGGTADKPVGTVWLAWGSVDREPFAQRLQLGGDRDAVRRQTVAAALEGLLRLLDGHG